MAIQFAVPYLSLPGHGDEAVAHYQAVLGATVDELMRWKDVPGMDCDEAQAGRIMHCVLKVGPALIMLADADNGPIAEGAPRVNVSLGMDAADVDRVYAGFLEGGAAVAPPHDAFWGGRFALVTDRFGVSWMLYSATR